MDAIGARGYEEVRAFSVSSVVENSLHGAGRDLPSLAFPWQNAAMSDPVVIDARGHRCPVPTLKLQKQMHVTAEGDTVILIADDPMAQIDVPHFCNQNQYLLQSVEPCGTGWRFEIARPA